MTGFPALLRKEALEAWRTYRVLIVVAVFLFFGMATPLLVKYGPELARMAAGEVEIVLPPPSPSQAIGEYAGTLAQIGLLVTVLLAMGAIARERESGTAALTLSKPVTRLAVVLAKFVALSLVFGVALIAGGLACYAYTAALLGAADMAPFLALSGFVWLFLVLGIAVTLAYSARFRSQMAAGGIALATLVAIATLGAVPVIGNYTPYKVVAWGLAMVSETSASAAWPALAITLAAIAIALALAWASFRRAEV